MNASEITFGIEIETTIPMDSPIRVGPHGRGLRVPQLRNEWLADGDPSIRTGNGRRACEFVSPVFRGAEGLQQLLTDIEAIKALGAEVNASCGLHIHVGFDRSNTVAKERLTTLVSNFEMAIYASTGTKNRERGGWCHSVRRYGSAASAMNTGGRYHVLNLQSHHPTVEFRPFSASLNPQKIAGYVCMCVAFVERTMNAKRTTDWAPKPTVETSPIHRNGEGQTQLTRFFYAMGWTKGRQAHCFGCLAPDFKAIKRTLMKLARKYDAQP
jgi:hypothetical protein